MDGIERIFPMFPNDDFYRQFDNPLMAYSNLPSLYAFFLENPSDKIHEIDHIYYASKLALAVKHHQITWKLGNDPISKKELFGIKLFQ